MNVNVKICGIRSVASALAAIDAGADFIGLNFVPTSKRKVSEATAREIVDAVAGQVKVVGVFQNAEVSHVNNIAKKLHLDLVQLHGQEDKAYCDQLETNVVKAIPLKKEIDAEQTIQEMHALAASFFLLDREIQGKGSLVDIKTAQHVSQEFGVFLAGGLTPENVAAIVQEVRPFAVDVAGGIETDGKEDFEKMRKFVMNAKGV